MKTRNVYIIFIVMNVLEMINRNFKQLIHENIFIYAQHSKEHKS